VVNSITMSINRASLLYGTKVNFGTPLAQEPRVKYQYTIDFILNSSDWKNVVGSLKAAGIRNPGMEQTDFRMRAQTVELPGHSYSVQTLNQYNRKRVITTDIQYNPITLTFHDTKDNIIENLIRAYNLYYFGNLEKPVRTYNMDTIPSTGGIDADDIDNLPGEPGGDPEETGYGFKPPPNDADKYFFKQININREYGNAEPNTSVTSNKQLTNLNAKVIIDQVSVINPMMTAVNHDSLSYADSTPVTWTLNFAYEAIEYGNHFRNNPPDNTLSYVKAGGVQ